MPSLQGKVAVVTGASRGGARDRAGDRRGGATVYVTGRTVRGARSTANRAETIEETAERASARGGVGIPVRLVPEMAHALRHPQIAVVALAPGFIRTEVVLGHFGASEENWRTVRGLAHTESPQWIGRAVVALAADPNVMEKTGRLLEVGDLAGKCGFTDVDGRYVPPFRAKLDEGGWRCRRRLASRQATMIRSRPLGRKRSLW